MADSEEIVVGVVKYPDRKNLVMRYKDPDTGKHVTRSAETANETEARKKAAQWEADVRAGRYAKPSKVTWEEFRERYFRDHLSGLAEETRGKVDGVFNTLERIVNPQHLRSLTAERITFYQSKLRQEGRSESTIASHLGHISAALNWAVEQELLPRRPKIKRPPRAKKGKRGKVKPMKGRPITAEEFDRILDKVAAGLMARSMRTRPKQEGQSAQKRKSPKPAEQSPPTAEVVAAWQDYLRGLWLSGLRLGESLELSWDDDAGLWVDLTGRFPVLRIRAEAEKGNEDRLLPIPPDFAEFLTAIPEDQRTGPVFKLPCRRGTARRLDSQYVSAVVTEIGRAAGVKVDQRTVKGPDGKPVVKVKYASAHDLRRSFGDRWARKVMPVVLQELMRHKSIETTLKYYVRDNAEVTAKVVWESCGKAWEPSGQVSPVPVRPK